MRYVWRRNLGGDPQVIGEELERLRNTSGGLLQPRAVVKAAASPSSPLHRYFQWDDTVAARKFRNIQAQQLISHVRIEMDAEEAGEALTVAAFVSIGENKPGGRYFVASPDAMLDDEMRAQVLAEALRALRSFQRRYRELGELAEVFQAIEGLVGAAQ